MRDRATKNRGVCFDTARAAALPDAIRATVKLSIVGAVRRVPA